MQRAFSILHQDLNNVKVNMQSKFTFFIQCRNDKKVKENKINRGKVENFVLTK